MNIRVYYTNSERVLSFLDATRGPRDSKTYIAMNDFSNDQLVCRFFFAFLASHHFVWPKKAKQKNRKNNSLLARGKFSSVRGA